MFPLTRNFNATWERINDVYCWQSIEQKDYLKVFLHYLYIKVFNFLQLKVFIVSAYQAVISFWTLQQQQTAFWYVQLVRYAQQVTERSPTLFLSIKQNFSISFKTQRLWCGPSVLYGNLWVNVHLDLQQSFIAWEVFLVLTTYKFVFMIEVWKILNELF